MHSTSTIRENLTKLGVDFTHMHPVHQAAREVANTKLKDESWSKNTYAKFMRDQFGVSITPEFRKQGEVYARYLVVLCTEHLVKYGVIEESPIMQELAFRVEKFEAEFPWIRPGYTGPSGMVVPPDEPVDVAVSVEGMTSIEDAPVAASGKPKRGVKQALGKAIYEECIAKGMTNAQIVQEFVGRLSMSVAGARTYAYNFKNGVW